MNRWYEYYKYYNCYCCHSKEEHYYKERSATAMGEINVGGAGDEQIKENVAVAAITTGAGDQKA